MDAVWFQCWILIPACSAAVVPFSHEQVLLLNTGEAVKPEAWRAMRQAAEVLADQTSELADLLEQAGIQARQPDGLTAISVITNQVESVPAYRPVRFLPGPAARDRRPTLNGLRYWLEHEPGASRYVRYAVVTAGVAVPAMGPLRQVISTMTRRISRWASEVRERYDVEVVYRGVEYTRGVRGEGEGVTYHPHANVLYWPRRHMESEEWTEFLQFSRDRLRAHWRDNGRVQDPREIVKYVLKPDDLAGIGLDEIRWLFGETFKLRTNTPLGAFREFMATLTEGRQKVVRVRGRLMPVLKAERMDHRPRDDDRPRGGGVPENTILGFSLPMARHTRWSEPTMLVQRYDPTHRPSLERLREELGVVEAVCRPAWDDAGAPDPRSALAEGQALLAGVENVVALRRRQRAHAAYMVHTGSVTVRNRVAVDVDDRSLFDAGAGGEPALAEPDDALRPDAIPTPRRTAEVKCAEGGTGPTRRPAMAGRAWGGPTILPQRAPLHGGVSGEETGFATGPPIAA